MSVRNIIYLVVVLIAAHLGVMAQSDTAEITKQRSVVSTLEKQIADGEREIESLRKGRAATEVKVRTLANQIEARNRLLTERNREATTLRQEISDADKTTTQLDAELTKERGYYAEMVREAYRSYTNQNVLTYLFTSRNFQDMARRISNLRAVAELREIRMERIDSLSTQLSKQREILVDRHSELDRVVSDLKVQKSRLERDVTSARQSISTMSAKERKALQQKELHQDQYNAAVKELQKLIENNKIGATFTSKTSGLTLPVVGGRVKQYKDNMAEITGSAGANVTAVFDAKVVDVRRNRITGKYDLFLAHGKYITSYAGLSSVAVAKDETVVRGGVIGVIGMAVDIITMQSEYKIVFGVYPPTAEEKVNASSFFKR